MVTSFYIDLSRAIYSVISYVTQYTKGMYVYTLCKIILFITSSALYK